MPLEEFRELLKNIETGQSSDRRYLVIYDGACAFCTFSVSFLRRVDYLHKYSYIKLQEISRFKNVKIPYPMLQESIHVIDVKEGKTWSSTKAISVLLLRSPPAFPLLILLGFLRIIRVAEPAYRWVAQSRDAISMILTR